MDLPENPYLQCYIFPSTQVLPAGEDFVETKDLSEKEPTAGDLLKGIKTLDGLIDVIARPALTTETMEEMFNGTAIVFWKPISDNIKNFGISSYIQRMHDKIKDREKENSFQRILALKILLLEETSLRK